MDIEAIAKMLTPNAGAALMQIEPNHFYGPCTGCQSSYKAPLTRMGLLGRKPIEGTRHFFHYLTDLGLAVREYLIREGK